MRWDALARSVGRFGADGDRRAGGAGDELRGDLEPSSATDNLWMTLTLLLGAALLSGSHIFPLADQFELQRTDLGFLKVVPLAGTTFQDLDR